MRPQGRLHDADGSEATSRADDCRPALGCVHRELHGAMAERSRHAGQRARRGLVSGLRQHAARSFPARDRAVLRQRHSRGPQHPRLADGRLHLRQRAAREALRHPRRLRTAVPPRDAGTGARHAARAARQGRAADDHVGRGPHVAGQARQVVPRDVPRHQSARSAAGRRNRSEAGRGRGAEDAAGAHGGASRQPELRRVPSELRADGARDGEFRRRRRVADFGCRPTDRSHRRHERRDAAGRPPEPAGIHGAATAICSRNP